MKKADARWSRIKRVYGLEQHEYELLSEMSDGKCWICQKEKKEGGRSLNIDHDHASLAIRGLLCWQCNRGLQLFRDTPEFLRQAADYLEKEDTGFRAPGNPKRRRKRKKSGHINSIHDNEDENASV